MKYRKKFLAFLFAMIFVFTTIYPNNIQIISAKEQTSTLKITNVKDGTLTIKKGKTKKLKTNLTDVIWETSNNKVVNVDEDGKITGLKKGTATITVKSDNNVVEILVTVGKKVSSLNVIRENIALKVGDTATIKVDILPQKASNQKLKYTSSDKSIAKVSKDGVITGAKDGTANITVRTTDGSNKKEIITVNVRNVGTQVRMQDDFYQAINANILQENALTKDKNTWNYFNELSEDITDELNNLIDELVKNKDNYKKGSNEQKIIDFYLNASNIEERDRLGVEPVKEFIAKIDNAKTIDEYVTALGEISKTSQQSTFYFGVSVDETDSNNYILVDGGPRLILNKEYLLGDDNKKIQDEVVEFTKKIFVLAGEDAKKAEEIANDLLVFQQDLAEVSLAQEDYYDFKKYYNIYTKEQLKQLYSNCDIEKYLELMGIKNYENCIVQQVDEVKKLNEYLTQDNLELLKNYSKFTIYTNLSNVLTTEHYKALRKINSVIVGETEDKGMDYVAKQLTQGFFLWEFGQVYVDKYFSEESKKEVENMVKDIISTYKKRIQKLDWMSDETKKNAIKKLDTMNVKIGYPNEWPSYFDNISIKSVEDGGTLIQNIIDINIALNEENNKYLGQKVDKTQWVTTPQTVNAFYNPTSNDITFPAAILQAPFYDKDASYAANLGGIGSVIGHEISHAFDPQGSMYDENGNYKNWWNESDYAQFTVRAEKIKNYYSSFEVKSGVFANGELTLNENVADIGGMACILDIIGDDKQAQKELFENNTKIWVDKLFTKIYKYL